MRCRRPIVFSSLFVVAMLVSQGGLAEPAGTSDGPLPAGLAQGQTIGTIRATFDGEPRVWYVVSGVAGGRDQPGAFWMSLADQRMAVVGGYDKEDIDFSTFEFENGMPSTLGSYSGSVMTVNFTFQPGQSEATFGAGEPGVGVIFIEDVSGGMLPDHMYSLSEGGLEVSQIRAEAGACLFSGTFAGILSPLAESGSSIPVTDGVFEVDGCKEMQAGQEP